MTRHYQPVTDGYCKHCHAANPRGGHGLCQSCRADYHVCESYGIPLPQVEDPTEEELDAMIAEQRKCLPKWWYNSNENTHRHEGPRVTIPQVKIKGRVRKRLSA